MDEENLMGEIIVESFWGAIASFCLLQIFGYMLLRIFIISMDMLESDPTMTELAISLFGIMFLFIFLSFQSISFYKIKQFVSKYNMDIAIQSLSQKDELIKLFLIPLFLVILILLAVGYHPFPKQEIDLIILALFYIFSWAISLLITILIKIKSPFYIAKGTNRIVGILAGLLFFAFGIVGQKFILEEDGKIFAYCLSIAGLGITIILVCSLLMEDQIKQ